MRGLRARAGALMALVLAALLWILSPSAARPLSEIKSQGTLRVGMTGDYAPFSLRAANGQFYGADVEMAERLARLLGVRLLIVPTSWKTLQADLAADRFDIAMGGVSITPERAAVGDFSIPLLQGGKRPIVRCTDKDRYVSIAAIDRPGVRVIVNAGGTNERFAKVHFGHARIVVYPDNRTIFDQLAAGRADVMVTDGTEVDYQTRLHPGILCAAAAPGDFDPVEKAYWMSRDPALKAAVDAWLERCLKAGCYQQILSSVRLPG